VVGTCGVAREKRLWVVELMSGPEVVSGEKLVLLGIVWMM
jgi:hypothetical protein